MHFLYTSDDFTKSVITFKKVFDVSIMLFLLELKMLNFSPS